MAIALARPATCVDHREACVAKALSSGVADAGSFHVCRRGRLTVVPLLACGSYGQPASHDGQLDLSMRVRRVLVLAPLLGLMREDLLAANALASGQIHRAGPLADPSLR